MVVDARRGNRRFHAPPSTCLLTGEGHSRVEMTENDTTWLIASGDMKKPSITGSFTDGWPDTCLPGVAAWDLGLTGQYFERQRVRHDTVLYPIPTTLPVGSSWRMYQDVAETISAAASLPKLLCLIRLTARCWQRGLPLELCGKFRYGFWWRQHSGRKVAGSRN